MNENGDRCPHQQANRTQARVYGHVQSCQFWPKSERDTARDALAELNGHGEIDDEAEEAPVDNQTTITAVWARQSDKALKQSYQDALVIAVCALGLPPYMTDNRHWKNLVTKMSDNRIQPISGTTLSESLIPREAARVRKLVLKDLGDSSVRWVTISYDAGGTRRKESFLTIHATTCARRSYLLDAVNTTRAEHSGEFYFSLIDPVCEMPSLSSDRL